MLILVVAENNTVFLPEEREVKIDLYGFTHFKNDYRVPENSGAFGYMDSDDLTKRTVKFEDDNERWEAIEYWQGDQLRHRSLNLDLKTVPVGMNIAQGSFQ